MYTEPDMGPVPVVLHKPSPKSETLEDRVRDLEILVAALWGFNLDKEKGK